MNHWQMITLAYGLTFAALTLEVVLLFRRRRQALRQALDAHDAVDGWVDATGGSAAGSTAASAAGSTAGSTAGMAGADAPAGGGAAGARTNAGAAR